MTLYNYGFFGLGDLFNPPTLFANPQQLRRQKERAMSIHVDPKWYQVMSALRGCDFTTGPISEYMDIVKHEVTTRIRYIVFNVDYLYGADVRPDLMDDREVERLIATLDELTSMDLTSDQAYDLYHFVNHMSKAMAIEDVQRHVVWGGNGGQVYHALSECCVQLVSKW